MHGSAQDTDMENTTATTTTNRPKMWNPDRKGSCVTCGQPEKAHKTIGVYPVYCPKVAK
jgi:hypothetical protein